MDKVSSLRIKSAGRFIGKKEEWFFRKLPGKDNPLLFPSGEVTGDMHHAMGEAYLVEKIGSTVDRLVLGIIDIIKGVQDVFDHAVISIKGKSPLKHDCRAPHHPPFHGTVLLVPQIDIERFHCAATFRAVGSSRAAHSHILACIACRDMIDDCPGSRGLFDPADKVHENGLSCTAPPDNPEDFPFTNRK
jgi:hypothetical protein